MLSELVRRLRAIDAGVSVDELAAILWLAERLPVPQGPGNAAGGPNPPGNGGTLQGKADESVHAEAQEDAKDDTAIDRQAGPGKESAEQSRLFTDQSVGTLSASTLRVPGVASTDHPQDLRRALRPFARRVPSRWRRRLDEEETAARASDTGVWCPVYAPLRERWFELSVVVESSASMALWDDTLDEFVRMLRNQGGFRSVVMYRLEDDHGLEVKSADGRKTWPVSRLFHREHPHLMLLVSDAISARWRNGAVHRFLHAAGAAASVGVMQPLPERSWPHTAVGESDVRLYAAKPGEVNANLQALLPWWIAEDEVRDMMRVPVLGMHAADIARWARMVTARGGADIPGLLLARPPALEGGAAVNDGLGVQSREDAAAPLTPAQRLAHFRSMVSSDAYELAVFLSVPDPLTIPVMRLVQRTMLPNTATAELAEFFVGGLIRRVDDATAGEGEARYRFVDGVQQELTQSLRYSEGDRINAQLRKVGRYLLQEGRGASGFDAWFPSPAGRHRIAEWSLPFASVSREVLTKRVAPLEGATGTDPAAVALPEAQPEPQTVPEPESELDRGAVSPQTEMRPDHLAPSPVSSEKRRIYLAYARADLRAADELHAELYRQLRATTQPGLNPDDFFFESDASPGYDDATGAIREMVKHSVVLVFLMSPDSLASTRVFGTQVQSAAELGIPIVPILLSDCAWQDASLVVAGQEELLVSRFQALPQDLVPIDRQPDRAQAWRAVVTELIDGLPRWLAQADEGRVFQPKAPSAPWPVALQRLLSACLAVPNSKTPSGVHTGIWLGSDIALTCAPRSDEDMPYWSDADAARLGLRIDDPWRQLKLLEARRGEALPLFTDGFVQGVAERESRERRRSQLLALAGTAATAKSRGIMPLAADDLVVGVATAEVLYFIAGKGVRCEVRVQPDPEAGLLHLLRSQGSSTWPLPPEANGAPVILLGQCVGMVAGFSWGGDNAVAKDARTLRAAMQAAWCVRMHEGLEKDKLWLSQRSRGTTGRLALEGADLSAINLANVDLREARLSAVRFSRALLQGAQFAKARLDRARMDHALLDGASFFGADLSRADLSGARMAEANFTNARLSNADLSGAQLAKSDFTNALLSRVNFRGASIEGCTWRGAKLDAVMFDRSHADDAALRKAVGVSREHFLTMADEGPAEAVRSHRVQVVHGFGFVNNLEVLEETRYRLLAVGDSWFLANARSASPAPSLLHALAFSESTGVVDCSLRRQTDTRATFFVVNGPLVQLLSAKSKASFDAMVVSAGGDDLFEAARVLPWLPPDRQPTPPEQRLLLPSSERPAADVTMKRYISTQGVNALARYLEDRFDVLIKARDAGPLRGRPLFIHGYANPTPRPAPAPDGVGRTLQSVLAAYGIPSDHHLPVARTLMARLREVLQGIANNSARFPNVHYFDTSQVKLEVANANQAGASGDWEDELHPNESGYAKLAQAWSEHIESVLQAQQRSTPA